MNPHDPNATVVQSNRWVWFLDVLFGAVAAIALEKFEPVIRAAWGHSFEEMAKEVLVALCLGSFFVYDIAVHHVIVRNFPYHVTILGFSRFYLDLVMVFLLFLFLSTALGASPEKSTLTIIGLVSAWHMAAVAWHVLARLEIGNGAGLGVAVLPHFAFVGLYWLAVALCGLFSGFTKTSTAANLRSVPFLIVVSVLIAAISLYRWNQVVKKMA